VLEAVGEPALTHLPGDKADDESIEDGGGQQCVDYAGVRP
jgi:hypothetical protein